MQTDLEFLVSGGEITTVNARGTVRAVAEGNEILVQEWDQEDYREERFPLTEAGWYEARAALED